MGNQLDIVTVTKNDLEGIHNTVKSTSKFRATGRVRQIIIDSSGKELAAELNEILKNENAIEYAWQEPSGIAAAFNLGLKIAKGEWVWFLNGRDEIHPHADPENMFFLIDKSKADAIIFELEYMQSRTRYKHPPLQALWPPAFNWIPHPATLLRRDMFQRYGQFDEHLQIAMDGDLWFRFFGTEAVVDMLSIPITLYDEQGVSSLRRQEMASEMEKILRKNLWSIMRIWLGNGKSIFDAIRFYSRIKTTELKH
jgi:glycosyltransferase involved in cell wall biosynthesis